MGIIGWIILGLLAGAIAKAILPGDDPGGIIITTIVGIVGAVIGGFIAKALGFGDPIDEFFDWSTWIAAIIGAIILLAIYRAIVGRGARGRTAY
ncbi:MAG TPA: GlsB/YeaQ/YmgE family stress response membrane protein [Gaiellaceae bacterium]|nr:GlsB/YeaQ/YmgE family stress response membrane protein [Gaiellaceae bacterium]